MAASNFFARAALVLILCLLTTSVAATNTTTCPPTLSCSSCIAASSCGYCKFSGMCMEGTAGGSFTGDCFGGNWTWFAQECPATGPSITVITQELLSLPLNAQLAISIADPNMTNGDQAMWYCVALSQGSNATCPYTILSAIHSSTTTLTGLTIAGPIPAGDYRFFVVYKTVRSANMTLSVMCNASDLTSEGKCPGACPYTCPDSTCASSLSTCNCTQFATIQDSSVSVWPVNADATKVDASKALTFTASALYRQTTGSCATFDFTPFMTVEWTFMIGTGSEQNFASTIPSNRSVLGLPAKYFTVGTAYTLVARFFTLGKSSSVVKSVTFTAMAPPPLVALRGQRMVVGPTSITIAATVTDVYADATVGTWGCSGTCGTALLSSLSANGTNTGVFIAGPILSGTSTITLTYKGVTSVGLTLVVMATEVPRVTIATSADPVVRPNTYLFTQQVTFASTVSFNGTTTLQWSINDVNQSTGTTFTVPMGKLTQSTDTTTPANTVRLRATSTQDPAVYGETSFELILAPNQTITINAVRNPSNLSKPLLALSDSAEVDFTSSTLAGATKSYEVGYVSGKLLTRQVRTGSSPASFLCPIPDEENLRVYVSLMLNDKLAGTVYMNYSVRMPSAAAAMDNQLAALNSDDPLVKAQAAANLATLLKRGGGSDATANSNASKALVAALASVASTPGVPPTMILSALSGALGSSSDIAGLAADTKSIASSLVDNLDPEEGQAFLDVVTSLPGDNDTAELVQRMANTLADNIPVGQSLTVTSKGQTVQVTKVLNSDLNGTTQTVGTTTVKLVPIKGLTDPTAEVSVGVSESKENPYAKPTGTTPTTPSVDIKVRADKSEVSVTDLDDPIEFEMESSDPANTACTYRDKTTGAWKSDGLTKLGYTATKVRCATTHLTTFAGFSSPSSAGRVLASLAAVLLAAAVQVLLH